MLSRRVVGVLLALLVACGAQLQPATTSPAQPPPERTARRAPASEVDVWIAKLDDPDEAEEAIDRLAELGNAAAIPKLTLAWRDRGRHPHVLRSLLAIARSNGPAGWQAIEGVLDEALTDVDDANPRHADSAMKAAEAIGEANLGSLHPRLIELAQRRSSTKLIAAQVAAIRALGVLASNSKPVTLALIALVDREPPQHPRSAIGRDARRALEQRYALHMAATGAAINALADVRSPLATESLILANLRTPELFTQIRRTLVAIGPSAAAQLRDVLRGTHAMAKQLVADRKLDRYCGDRDEMPADQCWPTALATHYAAILLGDLRDAAAVPDLVAALAQPAVPAYYVDQAPGPTQTTAILDALRKIGDPAAAAPLRALWMNKRADTDLRASAIAAYAFAARDTAGIKQLTQIARDNAAADEMRIEAANAIGRLSRDARDVDTMRALAKRYLDAAAKKRREADKLAPQAQAEDAALAAAKQTLEAKKSELLATTQDPQSTTDQIRAATEAMRQAQDDYKQARRKQRDKSAPFRQAQQAEKAYVGYARMFQAHVARIEIAIRCKQDIACFASALGASPDAVAADLARYLPDATTWSAEDKRLLVDAQIDRAAVELGKQGAAAAAVTDKLLAHVDSEHQATRNAVLLALPKVAKPPCEPCERALTTAIAGDTTTERASLQLETTVVRNYYRGARP